MHFSYAESMCDPSQYLPLAVAAEEAGRDSFVIPDSLCYPEVSDSTYPYTPDGRREFLEDKPLIEPFSLIPVLVAKSACSVAVLTQNRFGFGMGSSPWPEDFEVTGTEWATRGARMDEMIEIMRGLSRGGYFAYAGAHYQVPSIKLSPVPTRPIPFLIGVCTRCAASTAASASVSRCTRSRSMPTRRGESDGSKTRV